MYMRVCNILLSFMSVRVKSHSCRYNALDIRFVVYYNSQIKIMRVYVSAAAAVVSISTYCFYVQRKY